MQKLAVAAYASACVLCASASGAAAEILVAVSNTSQRMAVMIDGSARYNWPVSTGRRKYVTPSGLYQPQWLARRWFSKQYNNAPMPYSIFFHKGYAVHGTTEISNLGKPASHGCVRLHPQNAAKLFTLVQNNMAETRIVVSEDKIEAPAPVPVPKKPLGVVAEVVGTQLRASEAKAAQLPNADKGSHQVVLANNSAFPDEAKIQRATALRRDTKPAAPLAVRTAGSTGFRW